MLRPLTGLSRLHYYPDVHRFFCLGAPVRGWGVTGAEGAALPWKDRKMMKLRLFGCGGAIGLCALVAGGQQTTAPATSATPPQRLQSVQQVTVTADRGIVGVNDSASSVAVLTQQQLEQSAGFSLDDALHAVSGFKLFRRTSSWSLNPTSQGVSLRGLGSTAVSRTLVLSDEVPMGDPFGGWVHWNEVPLLVVDRVNMMRGGAADLYGSSAIGGAIDLIPVKASAPFRFSADASGASEATHQEDGLFTFGSRRVAFLGAGSALRTSGYVPTAPAARGVVDVPSGVEGQAGRVEVRAPFSGDHGSAFLRGNVLAEQRGNGTPLQTNATHFWRYQGGADVDARAGHGLVRIFGGRETYSQSFTSVPLPARATESLTKLQKVPLNEYGFVLQGSRALPENVSAALGVDLRDVRATDNETTPSTKVLVSTRARQRGAGGYADAIWQPKGWSASGSVRVDSFRTFDARSTASNTSAITELVPLTEMFVSPRLGLVRHLPGGLALTGTAFRAFRAPSLNELYRSFQVGAQLTRANNTLLAERATGFEFGGERSRAHVGSLRSTYFWTEINRPISAVLLSTNTYQRQNLGQIRSRGMMLEAHSASWDGLSADVSYQFAVATVTAFNNAFPAQTNLLGHRIPQVPRQSVSTQLRYDHPRLATLIVNALYEGNEFDDAENTQLLHPYARFDLYAERKLGRGLSIYASSQNVLNRAIDAGKTPTPTLAAPRIVQGGVRFTLSK